MRYHENQLQLLLPGSALQKMLRVAQHQPLAKDRLSGGLLISNLKSTAGVLEKLRPRLDSETVLFLIKVIYDIGPHGVIASLIEDDIEHPTPAERTGVVLIHRMFRRVWVQAGRLPALCPVLPAVLRQIPPEQQDCAFPVSTYVQSAGRNF